MRYVLIALSLCLVGCGKLPLCDVSLLTKDMTALSVEKACGKPAEINADSSSEQWVYNRVTYVYIRDGHFSSAQWSKKP